MGVQRKRRRQERRRGTDGVGGVLVEVAIEADGESTEENARMRGL